jgi:hypothetical protein
MKDKIFHKNQVEDVELENETINNKFHIEGQ